MTDKQIIEEDMVNAKDFCPYYSCEVDCYESRMCQWFVDTLQQLKRKEQECEELKKSVRKNKDKRKKATEKYLKLKEYTNKNYNPFELDIEKAENKMLKQTLAEIKPILKFYANSNMGEEQPDKTYKIILNGRYITVYDPKPARQALQKISEVKND